MLLLLLGRQAELQRFVFDMDDSNAKLSSVVPYKVWGHSNAREAASTVPIRLGCLHASNAGSVARQ